jgi:DNA-binding response OmpR family regulator
MPFVQFENSDDFLLSDGAYAHGFYVVTLAQTGVAALDLIRLLRKRTEAGIAAATPADGDALAAALQAGADMPLPLPVSFATLKAVADAAARRVHAGTPSPSCWQLDPAGGRLLSPRGAAVPLNTTDLEMMRCFAQANGAPVERSALMEQLWGHSDPAMDNALHATVYRLRRRIEQVSAQVAPIQSVSRVGYTFRETLRLIEPGSTIR